MSLAKVSKSPTDVTLESSTNTMNMHQNQVQKQNSNIRKLLSVDSSQNYKVTSNVDITGSRQSGQTGVPGSESETETALASRGILRNNSAINSKGQGLGGPGPGRDINTNHSILSINTRISQHQTNQSITSPSSGGPGSHSSASPSVRNSQSQSTTTRQSILTKRSSLNFGLGGIFNNHIDRKSSKASTKSIVSNKSKSSLSSNTIKSKLSSVTSNVTNSIKRVLSISSNQQMQVQQTPSGLQKSVRKRKIIGEKADHAYNHQLVRGGKGRQGRITPPSYRRGGSSEYGEGPFVARDLLINEEDEEEHGKGNGFNGSGSGSRFGSKKSSMSNMLCCCNCFGPPQLPSQSGNSNSDNGSDSSDRDTKRSNGNSRNRNLQTIIKESNSSNVAIDPQLSDELEDSSNQNPNNPVNKTSIIP